MENIAVQFQGEIRNIEESLTDKRKALLGQILSHIDSELAKLQQLRAGIGEAILELQKAKFEGERMLSRGDFCLCLQANEKSGPTLPAPSVPPGAPTAVYSVMSVDWKTTPEIVDAVVRRFWKIYRTSAIEMALFTDLRKSGAIESKMNEREDARPNSKLYRLRNEAA